MSAGPRSPLLLAAALAASLAAPRALPADPGADAASGWRVVVDGIDRTDAARPREMDGLVVVDVAAIGPPLGLDVRRARERRYVQDVRGRLWTIEPAAGRLESDDTTLEAPGAVVEQDDTVWVPVGWVARLAGRSALLDPVARTARIEPRPLGPETGLVARSRPVPALEGRAARIAREPVPEPRVPLDLWSPPPSEGRSVGPTDIAVLALAASPSVEVRRRDASAAEGLIREAEGAFDSSVVLQSVFGYKQTPLDSRGLGPQEQRRLIFRILSETFDSVADQLEANLDSGSGDLADCGNVDIVVDGVSVCTNPEDKRTEELIEGIVDSFQDTGDVYGPLPEDLQSDQDAALEGKRAAIEDTIPKLRQVASGARDSLRKLGPMAPDEEKTTLRIDLGWRFPTRWGIVLTPALIVDAVQDNYVGKIRDSSAGGKGLPDTYITGVGFTLDVPLGRGFGTTANTAPERAARLAWEASLRGVRHEQARVAVAAMNAYWELVASRDRLELIGRSVALEERLLEVGQALVEADLVAPADLTQVRARVATLRAAEEGARRTLIEARLALAAVAGLEVSRIEDTPLPSAGFPPLGSLPLDDGGLVETLRATAMRSRDDLAEARMTERVLGILLEASRLALKPKLDAQVAFGISDLSEYTRFIDGLTFHSFEDLKGPSVRVTLGYEGPIENNVQKGQLWQALALARDAEIRRADLERTVSSAVTEIVTLLAATAEQIRERERSESYLRQTLASTMERLRAGEATVIDTITTEEELTGARLSLVSFQQAWASLLTRLRFETGTLVVHGEEGRIERVEDPAVPPS